MNTRLVDFKNKPFTMIFTRRALKNNWVELRCNYNKKSINTKGLEICPFMEWLQIEHKYRRHWDVGYLVYLLVFSFSFDIWGIAVANLFPVRRGQRTAAPPKQKRERAHIGVNTITLTWIVNTRWSCFSRPVMRDGTGACDLPKGAEKPEIHMEDLYRCTSSFIWPYL